MTILVTDHIEKINTPVPILRSDQMCYIGPFHPQQGSTNRHPTQRK
jgi:hypothetical protein